MSRRVIVDTDTAGDDTLALLLAALSDRVELEGVTINAGNVPFEYQVENAKYTLDLAGVADDVRVYEGARSPLLKEFRHAEYVHGEGGLGGDLFPDTGIPSADEHAVDYIVRTAREHPGEITLACIAPLTNVALALQREPDLDALLDDVWIMGGAANCLGNVTPAAEYNFWVDPDAAKAVVRGVDATLVDWGVCVRDSILDADDFDRIEHEAAEREALYADFFLEISESVRAFNRETLGVDGTTQPDSLTLATVIDPDLVTDSGEHFVDVDAREGLTRGYSLVDELGVTDGDPRTRVVRAVDADRFRRLLFDTLLYGDPDRSL